MELNGYRLLLPEGTLDYFDLVDVKESVNEVVFYLEEKNIVPEKYTILEAAKEVLLSFNNQPMSVAEIYTKILERSLYTFRAQAPCICIKR